MDGAAPDPSRMARREPFLYLPWNLRHMPKQIVALCGAKGVGKSTLANLIQYRHYYPFAWAIKAMLLAAGVDKKDLTESDRKEVPSPLLMGKTPRHAMVTLGTEWGRNMIHPDIWLSLWKNKVDPIEDGRVLVDDVRFPNEIEALLERKALIIAIERPGMVDYHRSVHDMFSQGIKAGEIAKKLCLSTEAVIDFLQKEIHQSEKLAYRDYDIPVIPNNGTPKQLLEKFNDFANRT